MSFMNIEYGDRVWRNPAGQLHREVGPAVETAYGTKKWYVNGKLHRTNGPAIERTYGAKQWYLNGRLHRTDGPAYEGINGDKEWYVNGNCHRTNGPAVETAYGRKEWYFRNKKVSKSEVETHVCQKDLKVLLLTRAINPFCEITVVKYTL